MKESLKFCIGLFLACILLMVCQQGKSQFSGVQLSQIQVANGELSGYEIKEVNVSFSINGIDSLYLLRIEASDSSNFDTGVTIQSEFQMVNMEGLYYLQLDAQRVFPVNLNSMASILLKVRDQRSSPYQYYRVIGTDKYGKKTNVLVFNNK